MCLLLIASPNFCDLNCASNSAIFSLPSRFCLELMFVT